MNTEREEGDDYIYVTKMFVNDIWLKSPERKDFSEVKGHGSRFWASRFSTLQAATTFANLNTSHVMIEMPNGPTLYYNPDKGAWTEEKIE